MSLVVIYRVWAGTEKEVFFIPIFKPCAYITLILNSSLAFLSIDWRYGAGVAFT